MSKKDRLIKVLSYNGVHFDTENIANQILVSKPDKEILMDVLTHNGVYFGIVEMLVDDLLKELDDKLTINKSDII